MNYRKTKSISNKKTLLVFILLVGIIISFYGKNLKSVFAQEELMVCPLKKMVPVGSLDDQTIASVNRILTQIQNVLDYSAYASQAATQLINISNNNCKAENCTSDCDPRTEYDTCTPFPPTDSWCSNHGGIALTVSYDVSNWAQCLAWCNTRMTSSLPLCQYNADGPRNCWVNYAPAGGIGDCIWNTSNPPYGAFWGPPTGTCPNVTTCNPNLTNQCPREVCDEVKCCNKVDCQKNNACPTDLINDTVATISTNRLAVDAAAGIIDDFFDKNISEFPEPTGSASIFGKFCNQVFLSYFCSSCSAACNTTEFNALAFLESKAIDKINLCDIIKPEDIIAGKQGELLWTCKEVMPAPVRRCYLNDFFCCSAEESK